MSWNYRVLKTKDVDGSDFWAVHEVYYDDTGRVETWTESHVYPSGENWAELSRDVGAYAKALMQPALDVTSGQAVALTLTGRTKKEPRRKR